MPTPNILETQQRPKKVNLVVTRGDSLRVEILISESGTPISLTGKTGAATIRRAYDDPDAVPISLTVNVSQSAAGQSDTGLCVITATGDETALFPEIGVWDFQLSDGSSTGVYRKTMVMGSLVFTRDVTVGG